MPNENPPLDLTQARRIAIEETTKAVLEALATTKPCGVVVLVCWPDGYVGAAGTYTYELGNEASAQAGAISMLRAAKLHAPTWAEREREHLHLPPEIFQVDPSPSADKVN